MRDQQIRKDKKQVKVNRNRGKEAEIDEQLQMG
jgi:hypothetical protein